MVQYKRTLSALYNDAQKVIESLSNLIKSNSASKAVIEKGIESYLYDIENLCIKSRNLLECYYQKSESSNLEYINPKENNLYGELNVTFEGWVNVSLNTILPSTKYKTTNYIGDTISRLVKNYDGELPYYDNAFLAIVEYCNFENHNSLDNDNKGWKMIPNALKGRVIADDNQFILSVGLFAKISETPHLEIYILPSEDASIFMSMLAENAI